MSPRATQDEYILKLKQRLFEAEAKQQAKRRAQLDKIVERLKQKQDRQQILQAAYSDTLRLNERKHNEKMSKLDAEILELQEQLSQLNSTDEIAPREESDETDL